MVPLVVVGTHNLLIHVSSLTTRSQASPKSNKSLRESPVTETLRSRCPSALFPQVRWPFWFQSWTWWSPWWVLSVAVPLRSSCLLSSKSLPSTQRASLKASSWRTSWSVFLALWALWPGPISPSWRSSHAAVPSRLMPTFRSCDDRTGKQQVYRTVEPFNHYMAHQF